MTRWQRFYLALLIVGAAAAVRVDSWVLAVATLVIAGVGFVVAED